MASSAISPSEPIPTLRAQADNCIHVCSHHPCHTNSKFYLQKLTPYPHVPTVRGPTGGHFQEVRPITLYMQFA